MCEPIHHGVLKKKGGLLGKWKARTFALSESGLLVSCEKKEWSKFVAGGSQGAVPGKSYLQLGSDSAVLTPRSPPAPKFAIELITRDPEGIDRKKCMLCAENDADFKGWLAALRGWLDASPQSPHAAAEAARTAAAVEAARAKPRGSIFTNVRRRSNADPDSALGAGGDDSVLTRQELLAIAGKEDEAPGDLISIKYHEIEMPMWSTDPDRAQTTQRLSVRDAARELLTSALVAVVQEWKASHVGGGGARMRRAILACDECTARTVRTVLDVRVDFPRLGLEPQIDRIDSDDVVRDYDAMTCIIFFLNPLLRVSAAACAAAAGAAVSEEDGLVPVLDLLAAEGEASPLQGCGHVQLFLSQGCDFASALAVCSRCAPLLALMKPTPDGDEAGVASIISLNFLASGEQLVTFAPPSSHPGEFVKLFGPMGPSHAEAIAAKLVPVCAALHEYPHVRYCTGSPLTGMVALYLGDPDPTLGQLDPFMRANTRFWYNGASLSSSSSSYSYFAQTRELSPPFLLFHFFTHCSPPPLPFPLTHNKQNRYVRQQPACDASRPRSHVRYCKPLHV